MPGDLQEAMSRSEDIDALMALRLLHLDNAPGKRLSPYWSYNNKMDNKLNISLLRDFPERSFCIWKNIAKSRNAKLPFV